MLYFVRFSVSFFVLSKTNIGIEIQEICDIMVGEKLRLMPLNMKGLIPMALVTTTEMFKKAYDGGYAIGAFNVNNM